jgi:2-polyprenyl-6-hydroxyphenyl methylase/3-demethylubiquinone-9 3-methyltransferase
MHDPATSASADPEEMRRFERLAETWWDAGGPFWPLHRLNALRTGYLRDRLAAHFQRDPRTARPLEGLRVLDIGCGGGILSESMARLGARVTGIDVVARNVAIATRHSAAEGLAIDYRAVGVEQLGGEAPFDVVLNMEVVEHVSGLEGFMAGCAARVRPGGVMVVATLNRTLKAWLFAIVGAEYVLGWLPRGTHRWGKFVTPQEIEALCRTGGLEVVTRTGVRMNPFTRQLHLARSLAVNYMLIAARPAP